MRDRRAESAALCTKARHVLEHATNLVRAIDSGHPHDVERFRDAALNALASLRAVLQAWPPC